MKRISPAGANGEQPPARKRVVYASKKKQAQPSKREDPTEAATQAEEAAPPEQQGAEAQAEAASSTAAAQEQAEAAKAAAQEELAATAEVIVACCSMPMVLQLPSRSGSRWWHTALALRAHLLRPSCCPVFALGTLWGHGKIPWLDEVCCHVPESDPGWPSDSQHSLPPCSELLGHLPQGCPVGVNHPSNHPVSCLSCPCRRLLLHLQLRRMKVMVQMTGRRWT